MDAKAFISLCKKEVLSYVNAHRDADAEGLITEDNIYVVWLCKVLQNNKALLSTTIPDGMYYEVTYNGDRRELYVDAYRKECNYTVII